MLYFDEEGLAQTFLELEPELEEEPYLVGPDGWPTPREELQRFRIMRRRLTDARLRLEHCLMAKLVSGHLVATGYASNAPLDAPARTIAADRWRILVPDLEQSEASGPGTLIAGILVFGPLRAAEGAGTGTAPSRFSPVQVRAWYLRWVKSEVSAGRSPSRDEDAAAAHQEFGRSIPRDLLRDLRRELAPASWTRFGRRRRP
jgi:hypothetical protein